jgi:hypothetical protein
MTDVIAHFFLFFAQGLFIFSLISLGLIFFERRFYVHATYLVLLSILINVALKVTFQIPLPPSLGKQWFAFPSGHMQMAVVFYGWFMANCSNRILKALLLLLMMGIGWSLIHFSYHTLYDVLGGVFFAWTILVLYQFISARLSNYFNWLLILLVLIIAYIEFSYGEVPHSWMACYALLGFIMTHSLLEQLDSLPFHYKISVLLGNGVIIFLSYLVFTVATHEALPAYLNQLHWLAISSTLALLSLPRKHKHLIGI